MYLTKDQLIPYIRKQHLAMIVPTEKEDIKGNMISISQTEIANANSVVVREIRMTPLQSCDGRVVGLDSPAPILELPMYKRNDNLPSEPNEYVDEWLRALGGDHYDEICNWIAYALDFEAGPICALSLRGEGSIGKKLLTEGLAECFGRTLRRFWI